VALYSDPNGIFANHTSPRFVQSVTKAPLVVQAADASIRVGDELPELKFGFSGFVGGDSQAEAISGTPTLSVPATANTAAGEYQIQISQGSLVSSNYEFEFRDGLLTVAVVPALSPPSTTT
jgi:hypothetical protein